MSQMWFRKKPEPTPVAIQRPTGPTVYPVGTVVKTEKCHYLINKDGKRYRYGSERMFNSWNYQHVVETSEIALSNYPVAVSKLKFRDGSLLNNVADGKLYLVSDRTLRHVVSPEALERLNLTREDATVVSDAEIKVMKQGEELY